MLNAGYKFLLIWKRVVAALSLVAAAALAPSASAPISGSGVVGSRAGHGPALANAANALIASVDAVSDGRPQVSPPAADDGTPAKACALPARCHSDAPQSGAASPPPVSGAPLRRYAARAGLARAPPSA
jgi:hypothetical protein